jgi:hypothetical protein
MPRHFYGELARSVDGFAILKKFEIISNLLMTAKAESYTTLQRVGALWGIAHVGASEIGFSQLMHLEPNFVEWCIDIVSDYSNLIIRGTVFQVLGLLGRSRKGMRKLHQLRWNSAPTTSAIAVAIPKDLGTLFSNETFQLEAETLDTSIIATIPPASVQVLSPFLPSGTTSIEVEILNLIAKVR